MHCKVWLVLDRIMTYSGWKEVGTCLIYNHGLTRLAADCDSYHIETMRACVEVL